MKNKQENNEEINPFTISKKEIVERKEPDLNSIKPTQNEDKTIQKALNNNGKNSFIL